MRVAVQAESSDLECADAASIEREAACRRSFAELLQFYRAHPSRMSRLHVAVSGLIALAGFWRWSESFSRIGESLTPQGRGGHLTEEWSDYAAACRAGRPVEVRDELWILAHMKDLQAVQDAGLLESFRRELRALHPNPTLRLLDLHCALTLDERQVDSHALAGAVAGETAMAHAIRHGLRSLLRGGLRLVWHYARVLITALVLGRRPVAEGVSDRRIAFEVTRSLASALSVWRVYQRGVRLAHRGPEARADESWSLVAMVLGPRTGEVSRDVIAFYENPSRYEVKAWLSLHTVPARALSFLATAVSGQGLFETTTPAAARFRVFRRPDRSMHFVRELYCSAALRIFDSDFVVRMDDDGVPVLVEVFPEQGISVEMETTPTMQGGLSIRGKRVRFGEAVLPTFGLEVEFVSRPAGAGLVAIDGHLRLHPKSRWARFLLFRVLRRPVEVGCIHYLARPSDRAACGKV